MNHLIRSVAFVSGFVLLLALASCRGGQDAATSTSFSPSPLTPTPDRVEIVRDIFYTDELMLNVYIPRDANLWPVVVVLHGSSMTKDGLINGFSQAIAERGALVFTPTWRSSLPMEAEQVTHGLEDAACALRFAREMASDYGGDPSRLVVVAFSAGGATGAIMALAGDSFTGNCVASNASAYPDIFIGVDGAYETLTYRPHNISPEQWAPINPFTYLEIRPIRQEVEFHFIVGTTEYLSSQALSFKAALDAAGYSTTLTQGTASHAQMIDPGREEVLRKIEEIIHP